MTRNIVLIVLDTVRKDYFDRYASRIPKASGTSFSNCRAASSWSVPSHASIFTGLLPHQHDIHSESFDADFDFGERLHNPSIFENLQEYTTFGISSNLYINEEFGFDSLFDEFTDHSIGTHYTAAPFPEVSTDLTSDADSWFAKQVHGFRKALQSENPFKSLCNGVWYTFGDTIERLPLPRVGDNGAKANANGIREFAERTDGPFFVFANFMDAHNPLQNSLVYEQSLHSASNSWSSNEKDKWELLIEGSESEQYRNNYRDLYGASIEYLDRVVDELVDDLDSATANETTVLITADHGHNLGYEHEDGYYHHTASLSEGILHVPLEVINPPESWPDEVPEYVSQIQLPSLIAAIKEETWDDALIPETPVVAENIGLLGETSEIDYDGERDVDRDFWNRMIRCGYVDESKYEWDSEGGRYKYRLDQQKPCWQELVESDCEIPADLRERFDESLEAYKSQWEKSNQNLSFDEGVADNLKDLGYL
ncbi:sulfatase-like hydrolase/transferase [Natronomonas salina]|uniref:sulfatase-like hydrolase/transferase n=1 Tax=Natronomonas salina TaxID=1710540 RepID=UPI0015B4EDC7|nr:sulfatase-like hydrolase/transferase [Natronomonas salina]QLD88787.1 sulfatase-like hydrolase/transferase [Natronomonas salina]